MAESATLTTATTIKTEGVTLHGDLTLPPHTRGVVLFAHGSGSSRRSPRNRVVAEALHRRGLATLLVDLLTPDEEVRDARTRDLRFDIGMLADRLVGIADWLAGEPETTALSLGLFGASTGAAAALVTAASRPAHAAAGSRSAEAAVGSGPAQAAAGKADAGGRSAQAVAGSRSAPAAAGSRSAPAAAGSRSAPAAAGSSPAQAAGRDATAGRPGPGAGWDGGNQGAEESGAGQFAAEGRRARVAAVVSRGGRPDLAGPALIQVGAPTLLLVGELDLAVRDLNEQARNAMTAAAEVRIVPGATHLFEEPGALDVVADEAAAWFGTYL